MTDTIMPFDASPSVPFDHTSASDWEGAVSGWETRLDNPLPQTESHPLTAEPETSQLQVLSLQDRFKNNDYSDVAITRLLHPNTSEWVIYFLLEQHASLESLLEPHQMHPEVLTNIAVQEDGSDRLCELERTWPRFRALHFGGREIIMIFERPSWIDDARAVLEHAPELVQTHGFKPEQIIALATSAHHPGAITLWVLQQACAGLAAMQFSHQDMVDTIRPPKGIEITQLLINNQLLFSSLKLTGENLRPLFRQDFDACCQHITRHQASYRSRPWQAEDIITDTLNAVSAPKTAKRAAGKCHPIRPVQRARLSNTGEAPPLLVRIPGVFFQPSPELECLLVNPAPPAEVQGPL